MRARGNSEPKGLLKSKLSGARKIRSLVVVDPLAESRGHLLEDDLFWARSLPSRVDRFRLISSKESVADIRRSFPDVDLRAHSRIGEIGLQLTNSHHVKYFARSSILASGYDAALFQSFNELSALWFSLINPGVRLYLIVTNNLTGIGSSSGKKRALQRILFRRAAGIFVGSNFERQLIADLFPEVDVTKIYRIPYHKLGATRSIRSLEERRREIVFLGAPTEERGVDRFIRWASRDVASSFEYSIYGDLESVSTQLSGAACATPRIKVRNCYLSDEEYHSVIANAAFVALPFKKSFEGRLSGVLCDAISHGTPVIASMQEPHIDMFRSYGAFGYLVPSEPDNDSNFSWQKPIESEWLAFQEAMARVRRANSTDAIARFVTDVIFS